MFASFWNDSRSLPEARRTRRLRWWERIGHTPGAGRHLNLCGGVASASAINCQGYGFLRAEPGDALRTKEVCFFQRQLCRLRGTIPFLALHPLCGLIALFVSAGHFFLSLLECCTRSCRHRVSLLLFTLSYFRSNQRPATRTDLARPIICKNRITIQLISISYQASP